MCQLSIDLLHVGTELGTIKYVMVLLVCEQDLHGDVLNMLTQVGWISAVHVSCLKTRYL